MPVCYACMLFDCMLVFDTSLKEWICLHLVFCMPMDQADRKVGIVTATKRLEFLWFLLQMVPFSCGPCNFCAMPPFNFEHGCCLSGVSFFMGCELTYIGLLLEKCSCWGIRFQSHHLNGVSVYESFIHSSKKIGRWGKPSTGGVDWNDTIYVTAPSVPVKM
jgi:hypothetical protein